MKTCLRGLHGMAFTGTCIGGHISKMSDKHRFERRRLPCAILSAVTNVL